MTGRMEYLLYMLEKHGGTAKRIEDALELERQHKHKRDQEKLQKKKETSGPIGKAVASGQMAVNDAVDKVSKVNHGISSLGTRMVKKQVHDREVLKKGMDQMTPTERSGAVTGYYSPDEIEKRIKSAKKSAKGVKEDILSNAEKRHRKYTKEDVLYKIIESYTLGIITESEKSDLLNYFMKK